MKTNKSLKISLRIIALFTVAISLSFIPEYYHSFFGDWHCDGGIYEVSFLKNQNTIIKDCTYGQYTHSATWHWGYRHWLYLSMGICLAIVQIVDMILIIDKDIEK